MYRNEGSVRKTAVRFASTCCSIGRTWMGGRSDSAASCGSINASAELVVPRSMSMFMRVKTSGASRRSAFPNVEFDLPASAIGSDTPQLQQARLGDIALECDRNYLLAGTVGVRRQE